MIAAIYARKSTEQNGVAEEAKSVTRQIANARAFVESKGWTVAEEHVYVDDGVSGAASLAMLRAKSRLLAAITAGPSFDVLVVQSQDRLSRRDGDEAFGELKTIARAGVAVWFYADGTQFEYGTFATNTLGFLRGEFAAEFRRAIAAKTTEAMRRKAQLGHVTGGRGFGYDNVRLGSHVERRVNEAEAAIVRRIFELCADGVGMKTIAATLNEEGATTPRAQQGRRNAWAPSSVREVLMRDLYRGQIVWNKTRKRDQSGQKHQRARPESEWLRTDAPHLRIVSDDLWNAAQARLNAARETYVRANDGKLLIGPPRSALMSKYLLTGLARCGACGGSLIVKSRAHGKKRSHRYACSCYHLKGRAICGNKLEALMDAADRLVLDAIETDLLSPEVVDAALKHALTVIEDQVANEGARLTDATGAIDRLDGEIRRLTAAIAAGGGDLDVLIGALRERQETRAGLQGDVERFRRMGGPIDRVEVERRLRERVNEWRGLLGRQVTWSRQIIAKLLIGKITLTPMIDKRNGAPSFKVQIPMMLDPLWAGILPSALLGCPNGMASPTGFEPVSWP